MTPSGSSSAPARILAADLKAGKTSSEATVRDCLDRIAARDAALGAFVVVGAEQALTDARAWDMARRLGDKVPPLAGIPLAVKDNIDTAGPADQLRLRDLRQAQARRGCCLRRPGAQRRRRRRRQDRDHRVRLLSPRQDGQPARFGAHPGRLLAGLGGGRGCRARPARLRDADGGLDHPPRGLLRRSSATSRRGA